MSANFPNQQTIEAYRRGGHLSSYAYTGAITLSVCEYLATLEIEIRYVWARKVSLSTVLFLVNRYANICNTGLMMVQLAKWSRDKVESANRTFPESSLQLTVLGCCSCHLVFSLETVTSASIYIVLAVFAATRTYAIWGQNKLVIILVLFLGMTYPLIEIFFHVRMATYAAPPPTHGCINAITMPAGGLNADGFVWFLDIGSSIVFELVILVLTWIKTVPTLQQIKKTDLGVAGSLSYIVWYNGILHFAVLLMLNIVKLLQFLWPPLKVVVLLADSLTSILISRFILALREDHGTYSCYIPDTSSVRFAARDSMTLAPVSWVCGDIDDEELHECH